MATAHTAEESINHATSTEPQRVRPNVLCSARIEEDMIVSGCCQEVSDIFYDLDQLGFNECGNYFTPQ